MQENGTIILLSSLIKLPHFKLAQFLISLIIIVIHHLISECMVFIERYKLILTIFQCADDDNRRPGQRPTTAMLGNEIMNKEQLYDLFQQILNVKKFEHQLLYNAMQVRLS